MRAAVENERPKRNVQQPEPDDDEPHHRAGAERDLQPRIERVLRGARRPRAGVSRRLHAEKSGESGKEAARQKRHGNDRVLQTVRGEHGEKHGEHDEDGGDDFVLLFQIRHRAVAHVLRDPPHRRRAFVARFHLPVKMRRERERDGGCRGNRPENGLADDVCMHRVYKRKMTEREFTRRQNASQVF